MIFRPVLNQEIYVHFPLRRRDNSLILAFSTSRTLKKTYLVNGERMTANSVTSVVLAMQSTALGVPRALFLPKDGSRNKSQLKLPTLTITKNGLAVWKKSLVWWTCRRLAKSEKRSRCTVSLTEETSSVDEVFASRRITSKYNCIMLFLVASVLHGPTKFLRSATCSPGTFL